jgi:hypothetical protein
MPGTTAVPLPQLIETLHLNGPRLLRFRRDWIEVLTEFQRKSRDLDEPNRTRELQKWFGYPDDIPDLRSLRPVGNSKPAGKDQCYYVLLENRSIPPIY